MADVQIIDTRTPHSAFVDVLAWILIAVAGYSALVCLPVPAVVDTLFPRLHLRVVVDAGSADSPLAHYVVANLPGFLTGTLVLSGAALCAAVGLLLRKNWARLAVVALLAGAIAAIFGAVIMQALATWSVPTTAIGASADLDSNLLWLLEVLRAYAYLLAVGLCALFGWLIARLRSRAIRAEFWAPHEFP